MLDWTSAGASAQRGCRISILGDTPNMLRHGPEQPVLVWVGSNFETGPALGGALDQGTYRASFQLKIIVGFSDPKFPNTGSRSLLFDLMDIPINMSSVFTSLSHEKCYIFTGQFTQPFSQKELCKVTHPFLFENLLSTNTPANLLQVRMVK